MVVPGYDGQAVSNTPRPDHPEDSRIDPYLARTLLLGRRVEAVPSIVLECQQLTPQELARRYSEDPEFRKRCEANR